MGNYPLETLGHSDIGLCPPPPRSPRMTAAPITVIIPTYNRVSLLRRALESVLAQTLAAAQVIVVDDGSTDDTSEMISRDFPGVEYLHQANQGVSAARNRGLEKAIQPWIAFLDSDDEWLPKKLEKQMRALEENSTLLFCHTEEIWIRNGRRVNAMSKHAKHGGDIFEYCLGLCCVSPSSVVIHREIFDAVGNFDETLPTCEDYDLWLRICSRYDVLFIDEALITKYGGHDDQLSKEHWGMDRFRIVALEKIMNAPHLSFAQRKLTMEALMTKLRIFLLGAKKRGRDDALTQAYERQVHHWERFTPQVEIHG